MTIANTTIQIRKSTTSGNTPSSLANGELAINSADGKLFYRTPAGSIASIQNQQSFATINSNSSLILAGSGSDTLSIVPGNNISINTNTGTKTITINSTASGGVFNYFQNTAPATANSNDYWTNSDTGIMYENFGTPAAPVWAEVGPTNVVANTQPGDGVFSNLTVTGQTNLGGNVGSETVRVVSGTNTGKYTVFESQTSQNFQLIGAANSSNLGLYATGGGVIRFYTASGLQEQQMAVTRTASAVNYLQVTGGGTGNYPTVSAQGPDSYIGLTFQAKSAPLSLGTRLGGNPSLQIIDSGSSPANYFRLVGSSTSLSPVFYTGGTDTDISQVFQTKGAGAIDLAVGSGGVNISNGNSVTAITLTGAGTGYTSFPTATVSTPTTAGGVQAVVSFPRMYPSGVSSIASGGTGYSVNDVLTLVGGTPVSSAATITVSSVSAGVITGITITAANSYTSLPPAPTSVTGGTGTGATFNFTYSLGAAVTISNAGSGYVEQPTVSFSGGGGSGAAAYATVGGTAVVKGLGTTTNITNPSGVALSLVDGANANPNALTVKNAGTTQLYPSVSNTDLALSSNGTGSIRFLTATVSNEQFRVSHTASAVNYVQVTGAATGGQTLITAQGSDASIDLGIKAKGSYDTYVGNANGWGLRARGSSSVGNYFQIAGSNASASPVISAIGADTNISQVFQSKGTGAIDLAAGSSGVNISNGGTVTAITATSGGSYTSIPAVAITAPTTAGGVQATATVAMAQLTTAIASGGTGYTVNDVLTFVGGTGTAITVTVTTVSAGVITGITVSAGGTYTVLPTNPISVTGGTGTGATFNVTAWQIRSGGFNITNAGSGYVEQPTVSFSGGGGSGAAAYAAVGSGTVVKSIGSTMSFTTPAGEGLRVADAGNAGVGYVQIGGGNSPYITSQGTNAPLAVSSNGTGTLWLRTNGAGTNQLAVSHTASAVNYVQVTGAATGAYPSISAQGSDTSISFNLNSKGAGDVRLVTGGYGWVRLFPNGTEVVRATGVASGVNYVNFTGAAAGAAPSMASAGTDTNIDLALTPKGTGAVNTTSRLVVTHTPATTVNTAIEIVAANTKGGSGYADFLSVTNASGGTNPNKYLRINQTGTLEIINSAYTTNILQLLDSGDLIISGNTTFNGIAPGYAQNRPGFRVYGGGTTNIDASNTAQTLTSSNWVVDWSQGSYLNGTTGVFTAPVAGLYSVNLTARTQLNNYAGVSAIAVVKTTGGTSTNVCYVEFYNNTTMNHAGSSTVVKLAVGDTLKVVATTGKLTFDLNDNWAVAYLG